MKKMKRTLAMLLASTMLLGLLAACDSAEKPSGSPDPDATGTPIVIGDEYPIEPEELGSGEVKWSEEKTADGWMKVTNNGGETLGYSPDSGVKLIQVSGFAFKDLNRNGKLDLYEDWRQEDNARAADIAAQLDADTIIPLMVVSMEASFSGMSGALKDEQKALLDEGKLFLHGSSTGDVRAAVQWVNEAQAYTESIGSFGIPLMLHDDPFTNNKENVTHFPNNLALGATFDPEIAKEISSYVSQVYRAIGIGTLLGPSMDLATEPRWSRVSGTFGEDPALSRDMAEAATSGHQSTYDESGKDIGWGVDSVNTMIKHFPGDGAAQFGREAHSATGAWNVYPGENFEAHLIPFIDGALGTTSLTGAPTGVMPSYSIAWSENEDYGELVASAYSEYKLQLLRSYGFDGLICSDWEILPNPGAFTGPGTAGKCYGVEDLTVTERAYKALKAGLDQFGGQSDLAPIREAYQMLVDDIGEEDALARLRETARRVLLADFYVGYFENAYLTVDNARTVFSDAQAEEAARTAQVKSIVMLKNDGAIAENTGADKPTVYIPMTLKSGNIALPVDAQEASQYFNVVTDTVSDTKTGAPDRNGDPTYSYDDIIRATASELAACDYALVFATAPKSSALQDADGNYLPYSLQYRPYTANSASVRTESLTGPVTEIEIQTPYGTQKDIGRANVAYFGQSTTTGNEGDLDMILYAAENMPEGAKVIVCENASGAMVFSEFEGQVDGILIGFGVDNEAFLDVVSGKVEPSGLLPLQMPANMETVEAQYEDVPRDMECHVDANGNTYDFGFGLNWSGVIQDERTAKYCVPALTEPATQPAG